jgi:RNA polymerase sigma factor (sigma-70 family)
MEAHSLPRTGRLFLPRSPTVLRAYSDERLVEQIRRGNEDAFEVVYDRHHRGILAFCRHMLSSADEAEDAVQQTFISAHDALHSDGREINLKPWLYTIARNRCLTMLRARREQPAELEDVPTVGLSEEVQQRADLRELLKDLHELPVDQRAALVLSEAGGLSHAEVGAVVGCDVAKVKSLVYQARSSLIETRNAREIPCQEIREQLATLTGGALRRGPLRRHVRTCEGCAQFRDDVMRQRKALAAILPVVPTIGLKSSLLASIGLGGGGGGAAVGGAAAGGGIATLASSGAAVKLATVLVVAGVTVGGGLVLDERSPSRQAEAAGGQAGGGQAWPAPAAATGPGAAHLATTPAANRGPQSSPAGGRSKSNPDGAARTHRSGGGPNARNGTRQGNGHRRGGRHMTSTPPSTAPGAAPPAPSSTDGGRGQGHTNNGRHTGWTQGRGHQRHEQDSGGTHVPGGRANHQQTTPPPPPPADDTAEQPHGNSGASNGKKDDETDQRGNGRPVTDLLPDVPPAP